MAKCDLLRLLECILVFSGTLDAALSTTGTLSKIVHALQGLCTSRLDLGLHLALAPGPDQVGNGLHSQ